MTEWPALIRSYRKEFGLKQDALAYQLNVDQTTISRWERGLDKPSVAMQKRLRDHLWRRQDNALDAAARMVRFAPNNASLVAPGTRIIAVSDSYAARYSMTSDDMKGRYIRRLVGEDYFERYVAPIGEIGIYSGDVARIEFVTPLTSKSGAVVHHHYSLVPIFSACGAYAVTQSCVISDQMALSKRKIQVYRYDEIVN